MSVSELLKWWIMIFFANVDVHVIYWFGKVLISGQSFVHTSDRSQTYKQECEPSSPKHWAHQSFSQFHQVLWIHSRPREHRTQGRNMLSPSQGNMHTFIHTKGQFDITSTLTSHSIGIKDISEHKNFFRNSCYFGTPWGARDNFTLWAKYPGTVLVPTSEYFCAGGSD